MSVAFSFNVLTATVVTPSFPGRSKEREKQNKNIRLKSENTMENQFCTIVVVVVDIKNQSKQLTLVLYRCEEAIVNLILVQ